MQQQNINILIFFLTLISLSTQTTLPLESDFGLLSNNTNCSSIQSRDNQCLACWLQRGCIPCKVEDDVYECVSSVKIVTDGSGRPTVLLADQVCAFLNTGYGSHLAEPTECLWEGMGNWVQSLLKRNDVGLGKNDYVQIGYYVSDYMESLYEQLDYLQNSTYASPSNYSVAVSIQDDLKNLTNEQWNNISSELDILNEEWNTDQTRNQNFTENVESDFDQIKKEIQCENSQISNSSDLINAFRFWLSYGCTSVELFQYRLATLLDTATVLKKIEIYLFLSNVIDTIELWKQQEEYQSQTKSVYEKYTWNDTTATQLSYALEAQIPYIWVFLHEIGRLEGIVHYYQVNADTLAWEKCNADFTIFEELYEMNNGCSANNNLNITQFDLFLDLFLEFYEEMQNVNVTLIDGLSTSLLNCYENSSSPLVNCSTPMNASESNVTTLTNSSATNNTLYFSVQWDVDSCTSDDLTSKSNDFSNSLQALLMAYLGTNVDVNVTLCENATGIVSLTISFNESTSCNETEAPPAPVPSIECNQTTSGNVSEPIPVSAPYGNVSEPTPECNETTSVPTGGYGNVPEPTPECNETTSVPTGGYGNVSEPTPECNETTSVPTGGYGNVSEPTPECNETTSVPTGGSGNVYESPVPGKEKVSDSTQKRDTQTHAMSSEDTSILQNLIVTSGISMSTVSVVAVVIVAALLLRI